MFCEGNDKKLLKKGNSGLKEFIRKRKNILAALQIVLSILAVSLIIARSMFILYNLHFIDRVINYIFTSFSIIVFIVWILITIKYNVKKSYMRRLKIVLSVTFVIISILSIMNSFFSDDVIYYTSLSPSGRNKVVVFEGGFIDAVYTAYPIQNGIFYYGEDNGSISKHDFWGGANIEVDWVSEDLAFVKIIMNIDDKDNHLIEEDEIIVVSFS